MWGGLASFEGNNLPLARYYTEGEVGTEWKLANRGAQKHYFVWEFGVLASVMGYRTLSPLWAWLKIAISPSARVHLALFSFRDVRPFFAFLRRLNKKSTD